MRYPLPTSVAALGLMACAGASPVPAPPAAFATGTPDASPFVASGAAERAGLPEQALVRDAGMEALPAVTLTDASSSTDSARPATASAEAASSDVAGRSSACNEQAPQDFLVRSNFLKQGPAGLARAIQYRTDTYGYFKGFGKPGPDAQPPSHYLVDATFMGLPVKMHAKVAPALACVEEDIKRSCADHPYKAHALAGIRYRNTYHGSEVTNHVYGIAIDVDPAINTCCGCVKPWNEAPACQRPAKTEYDRMAMPECWVHAFERYGFYWLGHDVLRDTMHFEFLGDPDQIVKRTQGPAQASTAVDAIRYSQ